MLFDAQKHASFSLRIAYHIADLGFFLLHFMASLSGGRHDVGEGGKQGRVEKSLARRSTPVLLKAVSSLFSFFLLTP